MEKHVDLKDNELGFCDIKFAYDWKPYLSICIFPVNTELFFNLSAGFCE